MRVRQQFAKLSARSAAGAAAVTGVLLLSGCQAVVNSSSASQVRVIDASSDAPGLDIYENNNLVAQNLGFGYVTSYVAIDPGTYTIGANSAGSKQTLISAKGTFLNGNQYTVLVGNSAANLQELILQDESQPAPSGQVVLRFIDQATRVGAVDLYLVPQGQKFTAVTPVEVNVEFGDNTNYLAVPTGTYTLVIVPTGTIPTSATGAPYTGPQVSDSAGSAPTVVLIYQQLVTTPGLQVITAQDYVSPTATN